MFARQHGWNSSPGDGIAKSDRADLAAASVAVCGPAFTRSSPAIALRGSWGMWLDVPVVMHEIEDLNSVITFPWSS